MPRNFDPKALPQDLQRALGYYEAEASRIVSSFLSGLDSEPPPPLIYHYTNATGLKGIVETGKIWLTDIFTLNAPTELVHGFSSLVTCMDSEAVTGPPESRLFSSSLRSVRCRGIEASAHYYVGSFSLRGDDLEQWRAYGDGARGYAVAFDALTLETAFATESGKPIPHKSTFPISYDDLRLSAIQSQLIKEVMPLISLPRGRNLSSDAVNAYIAELAVSLMSHGLHTALHFKHEAYKGESEYRFLEAYEADKPCPEIRQRRRGNSTVEYVEFDWTRVARGALKKILVGPAADFGAASQVASACLATYRHGTVEIVRSDVPFRTV